MAYVTLSFLVQFPSRLDVNVKKKSKLKLRTSSAPPEIPDLGTFKDSVDPINFVFPSKHKNYCHIYYLITPFRVVHVSIVELDDVALIAIKDQKAAVRTIKSTRGTWVAFSIVHKMAMPKEAIEVSEFHGHNIEFKVSQEAEYLLADVLKDNTQLFLSKPATHSDSYIFEELQRFEDGNFVTSNFQESFDSLAKSKVEREEVSVLLRPIPSEVHLGSISEKIGELEAMAKTTQRTKVQGVKREGERQSKAIKTIRKTKKMKIKNSKPSEEVLLFTGQQLLYDKRTWKVEQREISKNIRSLSLWCYTSNLLSEALRREMIPFGIHVQKLMNLPEELLLESRLTISYSLGDIIKQANIKSKKIDKDQAIFEDIKLFFINRHNVETFLLGLQNSPLIIKISATRKHDNAKNQLNPSSYSFGINFDTLSSRIIHKPPGEEAIDNLRKNFSRVIYEKSKDLTKGLKRGKKKGSRHKKTEEEVLLGYANVDCSALASGHFRINVNLPVSRYYQFQPLESNEIFGHFDALRLHEEVTSGESGMVEEGKFVSSDTYLKVKIQLSGMPSLDSPEIENLLKNTLKRIVVITREYKPLKQAIKRVIKLNSVILKNRNHTFPWKPYWHIRKAGQLTVPENYPSLECALTGFVIRMQSLNLLVAEGMGGLTFPGAFEDLFILPSTDGRVMYNSKISYPERLYNDFLPFGGIFMIDMKTTTAEIIARMKESLLSRNFPPLASKALIKIDCLIRCSSIQSASVKNYFPSVQELVSFEQEFGVPPLKKCTMIAPNLDKSEIKK